MMGKNELLPPIGYVGGGLYHIGEGCYTGLDGFLEFEKEVLKEVKKNWKI